MTSRAAHCGLRGLDAMWAMTVARAAAPTAAAAAARRNGPGFSSSAAEEATAAKEAGAREGRRERQPKYTPPAGLASGAGGSLKFYIRSSNVLAEPYRGASPSLYGRVFGAPAEASSPPPYTLVDDFWGGVKSFYTLARLRKDARGFTMESIKATAGDLYRTVSLSIARGRLEGSRNKTTDAFLRSTKAEIKAREAGGWKRVFWTLDAIDEVTVLQGRMVQVHNHDFAQVTVAFDTRQKFCAYDKSGRAVAGDPDEALKVRDVWIFEWPFAVHPDVLSSQQWLVAGRMPQHSRAERVAAS